MAPPSVDHLLGRVLNDFRHAGDLRDELLWEAALVGLSLLLAWWASRLLQRRLLLRVSGAVPSEAVPAVRGFRRVLWPLVALALLVPARAMLARFYHVNLISLAISLVVALVLVRAFLYALRRAFPQHPVFAVFGRALAVLIWGALALYVTGVLPDIVRWLNSLSLAVGEQTISVWTVLRGLFWIFVAVLGSLWFGTVVDNRLMRAATLNSSLRVGVSRLVRAVLSVVAVLVVLPLVGIDLTVLSVFGGALGVGLGFGLQKVASNYVSGYIILFDRAVSIGDMITVEGFLGEVRQITTRYVAVRAPDGREAIVPNEKMITETIFNHSLAGRRSRISLALQVGYRADLDRVLALMRQTALDHAAVLPDPAPVAMVTGFADSGIAVELWCWVLDAPGGPPIVKSDLSIDLWRRFATEGIEIPLPQREIRILAGAPDGSGEQWASVATSPRQSDVSPANPPHAG
jgi:small-conductance mechanosensitive channel